MTTEDKLKAWEEDSAAVRTFDSDNLNNRILKLICLVRKQREAIEFAYNWALKHTPTLRPYDLTDKMAEALKITVESVEESKE